GIRDFHVTGVQTCALPISDMAPEAFFRSFSYGDLLTVAALETRLMARAKDFEYSQVIPTLKTAEDVETFLTKILWDETREMLGRSEERRVGKVVGCRRWAC